MLSRLVMDGELRSTKFNTDYFHSTLNSLPENIYEPCVAIKTLFPLGQIDYRLLNQFDLASMKADQQV